MTSPFLLAQKPKEEQKPLEEVGQTTRRPSSLLVPLQTQMPEDVEPRSLWQQKVDAQRQAIDLQNQKNKISPLANTIPTNSYTNIFPIIQNIGESALSGQIAGTEKQQLRKAQIEQARIQAENQKAIDEAYRRIGEIQTGAAGPNQTVLTGTVSWDRSDAALADMMRKAGFKDSEIGAGLGIAHAESGMNEKITHLNTSGRYAGTVDQGIFQINDMHKDMYAGQDIFDPQTNVNIAYKLFVAAGRQWTDWSTMGAPARPVPASRLVATPTVQGGVFATSNGSLRNAVVNKATVVYNLPYVWGGDSLVTGVDCSGLVQQVYKTVLGINTPRQARAQAAEGAVGHRVASVNQLQPGDLVAFQWAGGYAGPNIVSHIAIYAGNGEIIESYGGNHGRRRALTNSTQDRGAIYIHVKFPGE